MLRLTVPVQHVLLQHPFCMQCIGDCKTLTLTLTIRAMNRIHTGRALSLSSDMSDIPVDTWCLVSDFHPSPTLLLLSHGIYNTLRGRLAVSLVVTPGRVLHGQMLPWFIQHHVAKVQMLNIMYQIPEGFNMMSLGILNCLGKCSNLKCLSMHVSDNAMPVSVLGAVVGSLGGLKQLSLVFRMRNDLDKVSLKPLVMAGVHCEHMRLSMNMCDIGDDVIQMMADIVENHPPKWEHVRISLKHNFVTNNGVVVLVNMLVNCHSLRTLHLDLSYNRLSPSECAPILGIKNLRQCTLKLDGDVFQFSFLKLQHSPAVQLQRLRLSAAFCVPMFPAGFLFGQGGLRHLNLDLEGCHFLGPNFSLLVQCMGTSLRHSLETLQLVISSSNITCQDLIQFMCQGVAPLESGYVSGAC